MDLLRWQDVMIYLAGGNDPVCGDTTKEAIHWIAKKLHRAPSTTYGYYEGQASGVPNIEDCRDLHEALVKEFDCHVIMSFLNYEFNVSGGVANGSPKDDFWEIHELSTDGARFFKKAKNGSSVALQKYFDVVECIEREVDDLRAEGERIKNQ